MKRLFLHFEFFRVESRFHSLQSNEKLVARQEFLSALEPLQRDMPQFAAYSTAGLRGDCDLLLWRATEKLEGLQTSHERVKSYGMGKYLQSVLGFLTSPETAPDPPKGQYLFINPVTRTPEWFALPPAQQQEIQAEEARIASKHSSVKVQVLPTFGLESGDFFRVHDTDSPVDFQELHRELRASRGRTYTTSESPVFPAVRKDIRDLVDALG